MIRTQISFDEGAYRLAQAEAKRRGISLAELCRQALGRLLGEERGSRGKPWMRYSGCISGGRADASNNEKIDAAVYKRPRP